MAKRRRRSPAKGVKTIAAISRRDVLKAGIPIGATALIGLGRERRAAAQTSESPTTPRSNPRHKRPPKLVHSGEKPGWYRNPKQQGAFIGHFAKPIFRFQRIAKRGPPKTIEHEQGSIRGAGKLKVEHLTPLTLAQLPSFGGSGGRLNARFYSEGIETVALQSWQDGKRDEAIRILDIGVSYTRQQTPLNVRLYDLLAGLLVRQGRDGELGRLSEAIRLEIARPGGPGEQADQAAGTREECLQSLGDELKSPKRRIRLAAGKKLKRCMKTSSYGKNLELRLKRWAEDNGKWKTRWRQGSAVKWNGLDI